MTRVKPLEPLGVERYKKIVILTGAGISKASGLPTYRGEGGVWNSERVEDVATKEAIERNPSAVWRAFAKMRKRLDGAQPNEAHLAITKVQKRLPETWTCVLTQNVDGLHHLAGNESVLEAHGSLHRIRCTRCDREPWKLTEAIPEDPPACPQCGAPSRFDVVLFNEPLEPTFGLKVLAFMGDCELFVAVGTSALVAPANQLIDLAEEAGARTVFVNPDIVDERFQEYYPFRAEKALPILLS